MRLCSSKGLLIPLAAVVAMVMTFVAIGAQPGVSEAKKSSYKTLRHKKTKFRVKAPKGFKLKYKRGVYVISKGSARVSYSLLKSNATPTAAGNALAEQAGATVLKKKEGEKRWTATLERKGQKDYVTVKRRGKKLVTTTYGLKKGKSKSKKKKSTGNTASIAAIPMATLRRIANAARGGRAVDLPRGNVQVPVAPIALKAYTAPDGKATGQVPAEAGWWFSGANGAIEGYHDTRGEFILGLPALIAIPGSGLCQAYPNTPCVENDYLNPDDALRQVYPRFRAFAPGAAESNIQITEIHPRNLPGFTSALYIATFDHGGTPWTGAFLVGTTPYAYSGTWLMYLSMIAVPNTDDSSVAQALLQTWQSWDPSAAVEERMRNTRTDIQATTEIIQSVNNFRQRVYDKTNENWDRYIRGKEPILTPVSY